MNLGDYLAQEDDKALAKVRAEIAAEMQDPVYLAKVAAKVAATEAAYVEPQDEDDEDDEDDEGETS